MNKYCKIGVVYKSGYTIERVTMIGTCADAIRWAGNLRTEKPTALIVETVTNLLKKKTAITNGNITGTQNYE